MMDMDQSATNVTIVVIIPGMHMQKEMSVIIAHLPPGKMNGTETILMSLIIDHIINIVISVISLCENFILCLHSLKNHLKLFLSIAMELKVPCPMSQISLKRMT